jgi:opacity protein-like surface antigen
MALRAFPSRRLLVSAALATALCAAGQAAAQGKLNGLYFGVRGAGSYGEVHDTEFAGATPPTTVNHDSDFVGGIGLVVGKYWHPSGLPLRTEVEYLHRFRLDYDYRYGPGNNIIGFENNVSSDSVMLSVLYDFRTGTGVTPYVGAAFGVVRHTSQSTRSALAPGGAATELTTETDNLAWGAQLGATVDLSMRWAVDLAYRFVNLGKVEDGRHPDGVTVTGDPYLAHDLLVTAHYRF